MRVLGKPEISNAIKFDDLNTLMSNFEPPSPRDDGPEMAVPQEDEEEYGDASDLQNEDNSQSELSKEAIAQQQKVPQKNKRKQ